MKIALDVSDKDLLEAISIRFCRHYPAAEIARAFGGSGISIPWKILENFTPRELLDGVDTRSLDLSQVKTAMSSCSCCPNLVIESSLYKKLKISRK